MAKFDDLSLKKSAFLPTPNRILAKNRQKELNYGVKPNIAILEQIAQKIARFAFSGSKEPDLATLSLTTKVPGKETSSGNF